MGGRYKYFDKMAKKLQNDNIDSYTSIDDKETEFGSLLKNTDLTYEIKIICLYCYRICTYEMTSQQAQNTLIYLDKNMDDISNGIFNVVDLLLYFKNRNIKFEIWPRVYYKHVLLFINVYYFIKIYFIKYISRYGYINYKGVD